MQIVVAVILLLVGLLNLYPAIGVLSADQLQSLYGVALDSDDLVLLMRHRAILLGIVGGFVIYSVVCKSLRPAACVLALISMASFVVLYYTGPATGAAVERVALADIAGLVALFIALPWVFRPSTEA